MYELYLFVRSWTDPVVVILSLIGIILWKSRDTRKAPRRPFPRLALLFVFCALYIMSVPLFVSLLAYTLEKDYLRADLGHLPKVDVVVVLGAGIIRTGGKDVLLSAESSSRLLFGLQVFKQTGARYLILSGSSDEGVSEAETMASVAQRMGVPQSKIIQDPNAKNTWEQAAGLAEIIKDKSLRIGIVTSATHMQRVLRAFRRYFSHPVPVPSSYLYSPFAFTWRKCVPQAGELYKSATLIHELLGLYWYEIRWKFEGTA